MLGVDSAASMLRYSLTALDSDKPISLRIAHFAQFKAGRLSNIRILVDTFDLVEQALGRPIHLPRIRRSRDFARVHFVVMPEREAHLRAG